jgi:hypothetical protein
MLTSAGFGGPSLSKCDLGGPKGIADLVPFLYRPAGLLNEELGSILASEGS